MFYWKPVRASLSMVTAISHHIPLLLKRAAPAFLLIFLSPLVAEYLCGSMGMAQMSALPVLILLYGGGALLIREMARRSGRGYGTILLLALAYGILEEGIWDQSLFNPHFNGLHLLDYGFVPQIGLAVPFTLFVLTIHVVWSITVPVALAELLSGHPAEPWLNRPGLVVTMLVYLAGGILILYYSVKMQHFMAAPAQVAASVTAAMLCIFLAFLLPSPNRNSHAKVLPSWCVALLSFVASSAFILLYAQGPKILAQLWPLIALGMLVLILGGLWWGGRIRSQAQWTDTHSFALAGGALLTYVWLGFLNEPVLHPGSKIWPHALLVAGMLGLLACIRCLVRAR